jgi:hypothetical protein
MLIERFFVSRIVSGSDPDPVQIVMLQTPHLLAWLLA